MGETLVKTLVDTLWYIDGHYHVLKKKSNNVPELLEQFTEYNVPEVSKHRKRTLQNMSECTLDQLSNRLFTCLQATYWERSGWASLKSVIQTLATSISDYAAYLGEQNKKMKRLQSLPHPVRSIADNLNFQFLPLCETTAAVLIKLDSCLQEKNDFEYVVVEDMCPLNPRRKYEYLQALRSSGLTVHAVMLTYTRGNSIGNSHFVWKVPEQSLDAFSESQHTIEIIKDKIPIFHTRAMRQSLTMKYGRVAPNLKAAILRSLYREVTGDSSAATNEHVAEIDERVRLLLEMEDPDVVLDLRSLQTGHKSQYDVFWDECRKFLEEEVGTPVDDRRHGVVTHLARAISARDLLE